MKKKEKERLTKLKKEKKRTLKLKKEINNQSEE